MNKIALSNFDIRRTGASYVVVCALRGRSVIIGTQSDSNNYFFTKLRSESFLKCIGFK